MQRILQKIAEVHFSHFKVGGVWVLQFEDENNRVAYIGLDLN